MFNYITGFSVYTLAMIGIIALAFVIMKKCSYQVKKAKSRNNFLELETSLPIQPRKTVHVIRAGNEKFLLAADTERTTFLTKLDTNQQNVVQFEDYKTTHQAPQEIKEQLEDPAFFKGLIKKL